MPISYHFCACRSPQQAIHSYSLILRYRSSCPEVEILQRFHPRPFSCHQPHVTILELEHGDKMDWSSPTFCNKLASVYCVESTQRAFIGNMATRAGATRQALPLSPPAFFPSPATALGQQALWEEVHFKLCGRQHHMEPAIRSSSSVIIKRRRLRSTRSSTHPLIRPAKIGRHVSVVQLSNLCSGEKCCFIQLVWIRYGMGSLLRNSLIIQSRDNTPTVSESRSTFY